MSALNITEIVANLGDYNREHKDILIAEMLLGEDLSSKFEVMDGIKDELPLPNLTISDLIKPADPVNFTPTANALSFGSRTLKVRPIKVDLQIIPQVLEKTWLGKSMTQGSDPHKMPFEAFIMNYIVVRARENLHLQGIYKGVYNAAGTTPVDTMSGFLKLIDDEVAAFNIVPVVTGVITSANVIDSFEAVYDSIGEAYKNGQLQLKCAPTLFDMYLRAYRGDFGANTNYQSFERVVLDGTNCEIVREPGMSGSQRIMVTPKENMVYGVDSISDVNNIMVQEFNRSIKVLMDFKAGVEFKEIHARALAVNDQA